MKTTLRSEETLLSTEVRKALWIIAQAEGQRTDGQGFVHTITPDELADCYLREIITNSYPEIFEHLNQVDKLKAELIKKLGGGNK